LFFFELDFRWYFGPDFESFSLGHVLVDPKYFCLDHRFVIASETTPEEEETEAIVRNATFNAQTLWSRMSAQLSLPPEALNDVTEEDTTPIEVDPVLMSVRFVFFVLFFCFFCFVFLFFCNEVK
jgi:hypothetical protein